MASSCTQLLDPGALLLHHNPWRALAAPQPLARSCCTTTPGALLLHHNPLAHAPLPWRAPAAPQPPWHTHPPLHTRNTQTPTLTRDPPPPGSPNPAVALLLSCRFARVRLNVSIWAHSGASFRSTSSTAPTRALRINRRVSVKVNVGHERRWRPSACGGRNAGARGCGRNAGARGCSGSSPPRARPALERRAPTSNSAGIFCTPSAELKVNWAKMATDMCYELTMPGFKMPCETLYMRAPNWCHV